MMGAFLRLVLGRPVLAVMLVLIVVFLGILSLFSFPVEMFPRMSFPVAVVTVRYPGAAPEDVEELVIRPLEESLSTLGGLKKIRSVSREDMGIVTMEFDWGTDIDLTSLQIRERIDRVRRGFPEGVEAPLVMKFDPSAQPVLALALSGSGSLAEARRLAEEVVKPRLERLEGVAAVSVVGGEKREVTVELDPERLKFYGLSPDQVVARLRVENLTLPGGEVRSGSRKDQVRVAGRFESVEEIAFLPVPVSGPGTGGWVRLSDLGTVKEGYGEPEAYSRLDRKASVGLSVLKQTDANTVRVSEAVRRELLRLEKELPPGTKVAVVMDQAEFIGFSLRNMVSRALEGAILAVGVILVFLRHLRSTLVLSLAIPISLLGALALMYFSGFTLNMISLGGLALGVGRLVDDAIVVLENIFRHWEEGKPPREAAASGGGEVIGAITGVTLTTVAVFVPVVFTRGLAGELFREFSLAFSYALLASLFVALTVIPLASSRLLSRLRPAARGVEADPAGGGFLRRPYYRAIGWALDRRALVLGLAFGVFVASLGFLPFLGAEFLPAMDQGQVEVTVEMPRGTPLEATDAVVARVEEVALSLPETESVLATSGAIPGTAFGPSSGSSEVGYVQIRFKERRERSRSSLEIAEELRRRLSSLPVERLSVRSGGGARGGQAAVQVEIRGDDLERLRILGRELEEKMARVPGIRNLSSNLSGTRPEIRLSVDRAELAARGLSPAQVGAAVRLALSGEVATRYRVGEEELDVRVRSGGGARYDPDRILDLPLALPGGGTMRLGEVARMEPAAGPMEISRLDRARTVRLTADVSGRSLGAVYRDISSLARSLELPPGYSVELGGEQQSMMESFSSLGKALLAGILLVYMILAAQFESLLHPFTILVSVPLGITGALGGLALTGRTLNISSFIGIIMLTGIVVSNAIILVDYALLLHRGGLPRREAVMRAGALRLRPVLMTTLTTVLGLVPLALGIGEGAEFQAPMATAVLFGLLLSTLLTLIVVPVIYTLVDDLGLWIGRWGKRGGGGIPEGVEEFHLPEPSGVVR